MPASADSDDELRRLSTLSRSIERTQGRLAALYEQRSTLFAGLVARGVPQAVIARAARVTPVVVAVAMHKRRARKMSAGPNPARVSSCD